MHSSHVCLLRNQGVHNIERDVKVCLRFFLHNPLGGGARKWALRGDTLQLRPRVNRTLSKKVNRARGEPVKHCGESRKEERRAGEDRVHPGDTGVSGVGALGRAAIVANDAPRALTSAKPLSLLVPGAAADCDEAWGLPGSRENRR